MILRHSKKTIYRQFDISKKSNSSNINNRFENNIYIWWLVLSIDDILTTSRVQTREHNDNKIETIWDLFIYQIFAFELWKNKIHQNERAWLKWWLFNINFYLKFLRSQNSQKRREICFFDVIVVARQFFKFHRMIAKIYENERCFYWT